MPKPKKLKTYFVTANFEVVYECLARSQDEAVKKMEDSLNDKEECANFLEYYSNGNSFQVLKVEEADEHFKNHD